MSSLRLGQSWLDSVGSIQEKITVCASEGIYPLLRERVSQSKESWSRAVTEPDAAVPGYGEQGAAGGAEPLLPLRLRPH